MSFVSRGFRGRRRDHADPARVPPGRVRDVGLPVLSAGPTPHTALDRWDFSIRGEVDEPRRWTWEELQSLPAETVTVDIHCVTKWSKLNTVWTGVSVDTLLEESRRAGNTSSHVATAAIRRTSRWKTSLTARLGSPTRTTTSRSIPSTDGQRGSVHISTSGRARSGCAASSCASDDEPGFWEATGTTTTGIRGGAAVLGRLTWQFGTVLELVDETPRARSIVLESRSGRAIGRAST